MAESSYDLAIVGAGLAGGVLAGAISQHGVNPRTGEPLRIALLELGPYFKGTGKFSGSKLGVWSNCRKISDSLIKIWVESWSAVCGLRCCWLHFEVRN